jgi:ribosomal protein RSM22 (predicted rRNA methylase)
MARHFSVPPSLDAQIATALKSLRLDLHSSADSKKLAEAVKRLSDYFIANPAGSTPWNETWAQVAYLVYFLPLNHARVQAVVQQGVRQGFFEGLDIAVDFGAGFGTASLALPAHFQNYTLVEKAKEVCSRYDFLPKEKTTWLSTFEKLAAPEKSLAIFSYSLTELAELPAWARHAEALMLLEPSTQQDGRALLALRQKLLADGYHMWAPCPHQLACPLYVNSKTDWCHDRIFFDAPTWFTAIEQHLPMKNQTLTMSYLLARRMPPPPPRAPTVGRTVGDLLKEKGKDRQLICKDDQRDFFAWMHKHGDSQEIPRGELVEMPTEVQKVANELRVRQPIKIL